MAKIQRDLGLFVPAAVTMKVWDTLTLPIYWMVQRPGRTRKKFNQLKAQRIKYSKDSILIVPPHGWSRLNLVPYSYHVACRQYGIK